MCACVRACVRSYKRACLCLCVHSSERVHIRTTSVCVSVRAGTGNHRYSILCTCVTFRIALSYVYETL